MTASDHVTAMCEEFGIRLIPGNRYPDIGETRATTTLARIYRRHGEDHLRWVMRTLTETANNKALLDETGLWAASDLIRAYADVIETVPEAWFEVWDRTPVGELQFSCHRLRGVINQRAALAGMVHERLYRRFEVDQRQPDLLDERRRA
jgi:hypothetical protein